MMKRRLSEDSELQKHALVSAWNKNIFNVHIYDMCLYLEDQVTRLGVF